MKHTEIALKRPVTTLMVFLALGVVGFISTPLLPLEQFPDIQFPGFFVQVPYPGSTPEEVERTITRPIEESLATLSGVEQMQSTSKRDSAEIFVQFGWDVDASAKGIEARSKIDAIRGNLPDDVQRILVFTGSIGDQPILNLRISSQRDLSDAYDLLDKHLKRPLERLAGVSKVDLYGVDPREVRILLDAGRLAAHDVDTAALLELLRKSNFAVSAGRITDAGQRFSLRPLGEFASVTDIENVIINDNNVRLGDISRIEMRSPEREYGRHLNRQYAIGLDIFKQTGANMVDVADRVTAEVDRLAEHPKMRGIDIFQLDNQAKSVKASLRELLASGLLGALLAVIVLYLFLRQWSTTFIVMLAVPFSLLMTLGAMYFAGLSLNTLTMMGLMLAIGMLVDNAVVVTESVFRARQADPHNAHAATLRGVREVGIAVLAGTATSIIVFLPIMFGTKVDITIFLSHVAITIVVALIGSLAIAQTLVPMLAARIAPPKQLTTGRLMQGLNNRYAGALSWTMRHPKWTALFIVLTLASTAIPMKLVKFDTFPQEVSRRLFMPYHIEGIHTLERTEAVVTRVENFLYENKDELEIREVYSYFDPGRAESTILLTPENESKKSTREIIKQIEEGLPEIIIGKPSFKFDHTGGQEGFSLQLSGESTDVLAPLSWEVMRILETLPELEDVTNDLLRGEDEVRVVVDRERAMAVGLSTQVIATAVAASMRGENLREFRTETGEIEVRVAFRDGDRANIESLSRMPLFAANGDRITLGAVADLEVATGARQIRRVNRQTATVIEADLVDTSMDELRPKIEQLMEQVQLPAGYAWKFGRGFDQSDETQKLMATNIMLGIVLIFLVMAALFESTLLPMSIITSIAFSIIGVFWFFLITNTTFSFMASIGIMILIGVVVNNGIVLVDHINNLRLAGANREDAILQAGRDRLRPILMTVATTILGLAPLAMGSAQIGNGGAPYFPMARAIIGGLGFSTVTSLLVVPSIYLWFDSLGRWARKVVSTARGHDGASKPA